MEAVTLRGSLAFVILCALLLLSGSAAATAPLPKFEQRVAVPDLAVGVVREGLVEKEEIGEICIGRDLFCVGPMEPWFELQFGKTGAAVETKDVYVLYGHDPARKQTYGPYVIPTISDDIRICWTGCTVPDPHYTEANANVTLYVYTMGEMKAYPVQVHHEIKSLHPSIIPRSWCAWAQYSDC